MRGTMDAAGRIVIPKGIRERLGLQGGERLEIDEQDGVIEIRPPVTAARLVETAEGPVAVPDRELPLLTDEIVRATLERVRP